MDIASRKNPQSEPAILELGIFYKFDERAMKIRGAFTEIFRIENVTAVTPIVSDHVQAHINKVKAECGFLSQPGLTPPTHADRDFKQVILVSNF